MEKYDTIKCIIPSWAICALINNDYSELEKDDISDIEHFLDLNQGVIIPCPENEPNFYHSNDINNLGSNCYEIECLFPIK